MANRTYTLPVTALTALTAVPFAQLATPATVAIEIMEIFLGQETSETSQQEVLAIATRSTASTLPTSTTPTKLNTNDPASKLTGSTTTNAIGIASATGTLIEITHRLPFNVLSGLYWVPPADARPVLGPSGFWTLHFPTAPAANTWSGYISFREIG